MAWQSELVLILRHLVDDLCGSAYSDSRLEEVILVSAQIMLAETSFSQTYTIDVDAQTLSPDPTTGTRDAGFIALVTLKAACIIARGELRNAAAREGIKVTDKFGSIEIKGKAMAAQELAKTYCDAYQKAKLEYAINNVSAIRAIFNVVVGPNINIDVPWVRPASLNGKEEFFN